MDTINSFLENLEELLTTPYLKNKLSFLDEIFDSLDDKNIKSFISNGLKRNKNIVPLINIFRSAVKRNGAKSILFEFPYLDLEFLENYKSVYSASFKLYDKYCLRVHFFNSLIKKNLDSFLDGKSDSFCQIDSYIGFTTLRPLNSFIVGRTALKFNALPNNELFKMPSARCTTYRGGIKTP